MPPGDTTSTIQEFVFPSDIYHSIDDEKSTPEADSIALIKAITDTTKAAGPTPNIDSASEAFFQDNKTKAPPTTKISATGSDAGLAREPEEEKVLELEMDVVVGYGTMKKEDLTGSVVSVNSEDIARDVVFSVRKALQGKAAGVHITQNSGAPGKPVTVRIRGVGTINNSDPLYVVDGIPTKGIDFLNPNDIQSISILKDASATAIYGSRGANGVVLVTTKMAEKGTSRVTYDFSIGAQRPGKKPSLCNAEQWAILNNEARRAANLPTFDGFDNPAMLGEGTDWFDEVTRKNALIQSQNVAVSRGSEKLRYFLSAGYFYQDGIIKGSGLKKGMFRFNAKNELASWITIGNNFGVAHSSTDYADETDEWNSVLVNALSMDPVTIPRDSAGNFNASEYNNIKNPAGIIKHTNFHTEKTALTSTLYSAINFLEALEFKSIVGLDLTFNDSSDFAPKYYIDASDNRANAVVTRKTDKDYSVVQENILTYNREFFSNHSLKLLTGNTLQDRRRDSVVAENNTTPGNDPTLRYLDATTGLNPRVNGLSGENSLVSFFGRVEYNFAGKYLLTSTYRKDGSSRFAKAWRWVGFSSVAGAWKISEEPFMESLTFLEGLKLRAGWGKTGNQEIPDYLFTTITSGNQNYPFGNKINPGATFLSSGNPQIHWEAQSATNVGLDISAFGGRIEFLTDVFVKKTEDMLIRPPIPYIAGLQVSPMVNLGSIENRGVELVLNYREKLGSFTSNISLNFATYDNKILNLGANSGAIADAPFKSGGMVTRTEVGRSIGEFYGYKTNGLFQTWEEVNSFVFVDSSDNNAIKLVQENAAPGDIRYRDDDKDGEPDRGYIGSPHPDFTMGLGLDLAYRSFDLTVAFQGVYGNEIFNGARWNTENGTAYTNLTTRMKDRWTGPNSTNDVNFPRMNNKDANNLQISDRFIEDGSYLRLKTLQVGYTLKKSLARRLGIKKCRVYAGTENLLTFTRYSGLEPEVGQGEVRGGTKNSSLTVGVDRTTYPQARTFLVGLNLTL